MKKILFVISLLLTSAFLSAQQIKPITLKAPNKDKGSSIMNALANRKSINEYSDKKLSIEDLSDLLWAANGINRPDENKRTSASAMNRQDVLIYTFATDGVHLYDANTHELKPIVQGDHRKLFGERGTSPLIILLVTDIAKFGDTGTEELRKEWGAIDIGLVSQNIALFCSGNGLGTRPRASMDRDGIKELLKLTEHQLPMLNHPVGYPK